MKRIAIFTMALLMFLATSSRADLVAQWHLDNNLLDSSGNGNDGALGGDAGFVADGALGLALTLDGAGDHVNFGTGVTSVITGDYTIEAWIKPASLLSGRHAAMSFSYMELGQNADTVYFWQAYSSSWGSGYQYSSGSVLTTTDWCHIVGVHREDAGIDLYVNGSYIGSDEVKSGVDGANIFGRTFAGVWYQMPPSGPGGAWFNGDVDEVSIWDEALSPWPGPPTNLTVTLGDPICFDWDGVLGALKYSLDIEGTVNFDYTEEEGDEPVTGQTSDVQVSFGTSDRTDGGDMLDSDICIDQVDLDAALGAAICEELGFEPYDLVLNSFTDGTAKVKALSPGPKGKGGPQNNPFSEPPTPFPDL